MKKSIYTLAFVALLQFAVNAQSKEQAKPATQTKPENVNADGTLAPAQSQSSNPVFNEPKQTQAAPDAATSATEKPAAAPKATTKSSTPAPAKTAEPAKNEKK